MRLPLACALLACAVRAGGHAQQVRAAAGSRVAAGPNVVLLLADDYGWGDPSPPLGAGRGQTPELNAMAASPGAAHFPRGYIGGSVCSPSRASLLSGRASSRDCVVSVETVALPLQLRGNTLADVARRAGLATMLAGKWHLSSLSASLTTGCYAAAATNGSCLPGYVRQAPPANLTCCDGRDGQLPAHTPLDFGFADVMATAQVAPSSTSNCGCLQTVAGAGVDCNLGHYAGAGHDPAWLPGLECAQTLETAPGGGGLQPFEGKTAVDDSAQLVDRFEAFLAASVAADTPFLAAVWFHSVHIPYVAPPAFRALYPNATENEADYWGAASAMDAQVGRVRRLLAAAGVAEHTLTVFTSDNGPEVSPASGQGTNTFDNPGVTGGLAGRKRALLEGGVRVTTVVEAPWLVARANGGAGGPLRLDSFAAAHTDLLPTLIDVLARGDLRRNASWPLDGVSLVPALTGGAGAVRPGPLGWLCAWPLTVGDAGADCPAGSTHAPPSAPANFSTPGQQPQVAWMEGDLKLVACKNTQAAWRWRLFNVSGDPGETDDLLDARVDVADAMFGRLQTWLASVDASRDNESQCAAQPRPPLFH